MKRSHIILSLLFIVLTSCYKNEKKEINSVKLIQETDTNYRFEDFHISYLIEGEGIYKLRISLTNDTIEYTTNYFDTLVLSSSISNSVNLKHLLWHNNEKEIEFYDIENKYFLLQLQIFDFDQDLIILESNKILIEINRKRPDDTRINNFFLTDIDCNTHELVKILEDKEFVFIFYFATWCGWSRISYPIISYIDSLYNNKLTIFGIEGSEKNSASDIELTRLVDNYNIAYTMCTYKDNESVVEIIQLNLAVFPCFKVINRKRQIIYSQIGYSKYLLDSISFYMNNF